MFAAISTILFDLDGTIADTNEIILRSLLETLDRFSDRHDWTREELLTYWGIPLRRQLTRFSPGIDLERAVPYYRERYAVHQKTLLCDFPGTREVLEALHADGKRLGVVTSKKHFNARQTLELLDFLRFMEIVVCEEDAPRVKPHPDPLLHALAQLETSAEETVYVGDNPDDIIAAHAAGMRGIAVGWCMRSCDELRAADPDTWLNAPGDLLRILGVVEALAGA